MSKNVWVPLSPREKALLIDVLSSSRKAKQTRSNRIDALVSKLARAKSCPPITVEVQGGLVQCVSGNPFPVCICDYDIDGQDDLDIDARGEPCRMWFEPADPESFPRRERNRSKQRITPLA